MSWYTEWQWAINRLKRVLVGQMFWGDLKQLMHLSLTWNPCAGHAVLGTPDWLTSQGLPVPLGCPCGGAWKWSQEHLKTIHAPVRDVIPISSPPHERSIRLVDFSVLPHPVLACTRGCTAGQLHSPLQGSLLNKVRGATLDALHYPMASCEQQGMQSLPIFLLFLWLLKASYRSHFLTSPPLKGNWLFLESWSRRKVISIKDW